jgi:hypothetical protein
MMIGRVCSPALPDARPARWLAGPAQSLNCVQGRGIAGTAARGRCATPHQAPAPAGLGRPSRPHRAHPALATGSADVPPGHARHRAPVAPPPGHPEADLLEPDGTAAGQRRDRRADRPARHRQPRLGVPADPGRTAQTRPPGRRLHDPPRAQSPEDPPSSKAAHRHHLGGSSCTRRPRRCLPWTSSTWTAP